MLGIYLVDPRDHILKVSCLYLYFLLSYEHILSKCLTVGGGGGQQQGKVIIGLKLPKLHWSWDGHGAGLSNITTTRANFSQVDYCSLSQFGLRLRFKQIFRFCFRLRLEFKIANFFSFHTAKKSSDTLLICPLAYRICSICKITLFLVAISD